MPHAGWCRECSEWEWVDGQGGCQFGHPPDSVERVHEQAEPQSLERPFGVGEMPSELNRFSWGAFLLPLFWGVAYGSWPVLGAWALALAVPLLLAAMFGTPAPNTSVATIIGVTVVSELVAGVVRLWVGANANRTLWMRESFRLSVLPDAKTRFTVERFLGKQAKWTIWGAILVGAGFLVLIPTTAQTWSKYELTYVGAAVPLVWLAAEVFLGVWLDSRMRMEPPDNEQAAGDMI